MADHRDNEPSEPALTSQNTRATRQANSQSSSRDRRSIASYESAMTSSTGNGVGNTFSADTTLAPRSSEDDGATPQDAHSDVHGVDGHARRPDRRSQRAHRHKQSSGFLLLDPPAHEDSHPIQKRASDKGAFDGPSDARLQQSTGSPQPRAAQPVGPSAAAHEVLSSGSRVTKRPQAPKGVTYGSRSTGTDYTGSSGERSSAVAPPAAPGPAPFDMDSAQIVNMALNLSESRRLAARRNIAQAVLPRLAPLPDSPAGGSLRQHLQQQRRTSRTVSPKPINGPSPRMASSSRMSSPLQPGFEAGPDGAYHYHFSHSTLSRAQKAKDYLELLAQHRRALDFLPPLRPPLAGRNAAMSPPSSPAEASTAELASRLGRPYNPLQYIRNRKVRARERKAIDGEGQGFGDVMRVTEWVDEVAKWAATGQNRQSLGGSVPPFATADQMDIEGSPSTNPSRPGVTVSKPKRPRVDWIIDPADMIADIYWLEQDDNKKMVEDRQWRRVFPQGPSVTRPLSRQTDDPLSATTTPGTSKREKHSVTSAESPAQLGGDQEPSMTTKERAKQKLHDLRGFHHRRNSSLIVQDTFRARKGSASDSSDSDSDWKRRTKTKALEVDGKDILEKQMMEMIARENREAELVSQHDAYQQNKQKSGAVTPEAGRPGFWSGSSRSHSRRGSRAELSDEAVVASRRGTPPRSGRASLEIPSFGRRLSTDYDTSLPNSPELRAARREAGSIPAIGADLSPASSRPSSPSRNPLSKVKSIFQDRGRERPSESSAGEKEERSASLPLVFEKVSDPVVISLEPPESHDRPQSPIGELTTRMTSEGHKSRQSIGSIRHRGDDANSGLRSLFRTPRIDSVLRSGVSRVNELFWRRESEERADDVSTSTSSDDSDEEEKRGRRKFESAVPSRATSRRGAENRGKQSNKHYLDVMPAFTSELRGKPTSGETSASLKPKTVIQSRSPSRSRFELLKPPRIDVHNASPSPPPPEDLQPRNSVASTSSKSSYADGVRTADARLNTIISMPQPFAPAAPSGRLSTASRGGGPRWTIAERGTSSAQPFVSKFELARLRTLMMSSGIMAKELARRSNEPRVLSSQSSSGTNSCPMATTTAGTVSWPDIASLATGGSSSIRALTEQPVAQLELYPLAARAIQSSIVAAGQKWQAEAEAFTSQTAPALQSRVDELRRTVESDLSGLSRAASDEADELSRDIVVSQRLKVKRVLDGIERMSRRRRRRFRWARRAVWLSVEWLLVGVMWYVWFLFLIVRVFVGLGSGVVRGVRWLLWL